MILAHDEATEALSEVETAVITGRSGLQMVSLICFEMTTWNLSLFVSDRDCGIVVPIDSDSGHK